MWERRVDGVYAYVDLIGPTPKRDTISASVPDEAEPGSYEVCSMEPGIGAEPACALLVVTGD